MSLITATFVIGYLAIIFEHRLKVTKSASALLVGVLCWTVRILTMPGDTVSGELQHHLGDVAGILFFLLGAMTIVELIDAHDGFELITARIRSVSRRKLLVSISLLAFFLSAILDNLTTSIVMVSLIRKLMEDDEHSQDRIYFGGVVIVAANAGGAWSPIGDVTTTMLWIGGAITAGNVILRVFLPALVSVLVPVLWIGIRMKGTVSRPAVSAPSEQSIATTTGGRVTSPRERAIVLFVGIGVFVLVPVFKAITHLPPVMGILGGLAILWIVTELIHKRKNDEGKEALSVAGALQRIDSPSILFFLGILLSISALQSAGVLSVLARTMNDAIGNVSLITMTIGLSSAVIDNVPLVAAAQGMYPLSTYPTNHHFWVFLAYCAGTGGSILIIGSAAGIAVMGIQRITFGWYLRHFSLPVLLGYVAGALTYLIIN